MSEQEARTSVVQHIIMKLLTQELLKPSEILCRLSAQFEDETLSRTQVYYWNKKILDGRYTVENATQVC